MKSRSRGKVREIHVIPDAFMVAAAAVPFIEPTASGNPGFIADLTNSSLPLSERVTMSVNAVGEAAMENWKEIATLAVISLAAKWAGKKVGLNRVGTTKWRVM